MPSKRLSVTSKDDEYRRVRRKMVKEIDHYLRSGQHEKRGVAIERLKLWDSVHGIDIWDNNFGWFERNYLTRV